MSDDTNNVYAPPKAELDKEVESNEIILAERVDRLYASIIDSLIAAVFSIPFIIYAGPYLGYNFGSEPNQKYLIVSIIFGFVLFALLHGYLLHHYGQTIGKKLLKIKIIDVNDGRVPLGKLLGLRYLPTSLVVLLPVIGQMLPMFDVLFIFRKDRRCIHDFIAGTKVVKVRQ